MKYKNKPDSLNCLFFLALTVKTAIPNLDRSGGARQVGRVFVLLRE
jgi:hypothetical protein